MSKSRHIPKKVSDVVKKSHYFECAWCGQPLYDRHHIDEFSEGGEHTIENLILLCPNCHRLVHQGKIDKEELRARKSTHLQGDRIAGGFRTSLQELKLLIGTNKVVISDSKKVDVLRSNSIPFMSILKSEDRIFIDLRLYSQDGVQTFWMKENMYWAPSNYVVETSLDHLRIFDSLDGECGLALSKIDDCLEIEFTNYIDGTVFHFDKEKILIGKDINYGSTVRNGTFHMTRLEAIVNF